ncbi:MAG: DUF1289 domain-containing protein [Pseudomonadota bacterium]
MSTIASPCISICSIEPKSGHCYGCGRTMDEILAWTKFSDEVRSAMMADVLPDRVAALEKRPRRTTRRNKTGARRDVIDLGSSTT